MNLFIPCLLYLLHISNLTASNATYLFGASPSGGLWGVAINISETGRAVRDVYSQLQSHEIGSVSYDPVSQQILLELFKPHRISYGPLCTGDGAELDTLAQVSSVPIFPEGSPHCLQCLPSSFVMFNSRIYFLLVGNFGSKANIEMKVQLRVMEKCKNCVETETFRGFKTAILFNCSTLIAEIRTHPVTSDRNVNIRAGKSIKVIEQNGKTSFVFQLFIMHPNKTNQIELYHVTADGQICLLREEEIAAYYLSFDIRALADVDYHDGTLCWTVADRLYCSEWQGGQLENVQELLFPGEGASSGACRGKPYDYQVIVTGVAVAKMDDDKVIFFGCYPQNPTVGGTGMIKFSQDGKYKKVFHVQNDNGTRLLAGGLLVTDCLPGQCPQKTEPDVCISPPDSLPISYPEVRTLTDFNSSNEKLEHVIKDTEATAADTPSNGCPRLAVLDIFGVLMLLATFV